MLILHSPHLVAPPFFCPFLSPPLPFYFLPLLRHIFSPMPTKFQIKFYYATKGLEASYKLLIDTMGFI